VTGSGPLKRGGSNAGKRQVTEIHARNRGATVPLLGEGAMWTVPVDCYFLSNGEKKKERLIKSSYMGISSRERSGHPFEGERGAGGSVVGLFLEGQRTFRANDCRGL